MNEEKKETIEKTAVVKELPVQNVRTFLNEEEKTTYNFLTIEEALTKIIEKLDRIEKRITI